MRAINAELSRTSDRQRLLQFARRWLYDRKQIIPRERELRAYIAKAIRQHEATLVREIVEAMVRRYARRLASRAPAVAARIAEPTRTIEVACFLRYSLMISTDHLLWMVRRRVADLWRKAADEADAQRVTYERLYQQLLGAHRERRGPSRAQIIRDQLLEEVRPVRALLKALAQQPWKAAADHPLLARCWPVFSN